MEETEDQEDLEVPGPPVLYLVPYNKPARQAVQHELNAYFRTSLPNLPHGGWALYISFANPEKQVYTLGRADCDIFLPDPKGADISKHQCSLVNTENGAVLLEDKSSKKNTEPFSSNNGGQTIGFITAETNSRRVLIARGINNMIGFGRDRYYEFGIHWESDGLYRFPDKGENYRTGPRKSRQKRYIEGEKVGGGSYGNVWWVMDVHTGGFMAVKKFHNMEGKHLEFATREITNLFRINRTSSIHHDHILEILDCAGGGKGDTWGEIFMPLKPGNLKSLALDPARTVPLDDLAETVLYQMLLALDCIAKHKIVHRDLKPENVLWEYNDQGDYHFRLGDFGLSNNPELAVTVAGTEPFMAPEVFNCQEQTSKIDIWSLFATVVWVKNVDNFRLYCAKYRADRIHHWLARISMMEEFESVRGMASIRARDRPSAKRLLQILGRGDDDQVGQELADSVANALDLDPTGEDEPDAGGGSSTRRRRGGRGMQHVAEDDAGEVPAVPYYERAYAPENYDLRGQGEEEGEGSNTYVPPLMGQSPRAGGMGPMDAWVKPYDAPYGSPDEDGDPDSGTAVPDVWTARQLPTRELAAAQAPAEVPRGGDRKGKKKKR
ncbi:kinase-like domain-containing protein [Coniochaeta sp. 2T2.1]|nr:kinase-like domain-containing protein [Coniochaeta sp. 2T2.1]